MGQAPLILLDNYGHAHRMAEAANSTFHEGHDRCFSITRGGKLMGGVLFDGYRKRSICIHVAGFMPNWLTRDFLWVIFDFPFNQLKCEVVFGLVPSTNKRALKFDAKVGFGPHATIKDAVPGGDLVVLSMYRGQCRWLDWEPRTIGRTRGA